MAIIAMKMPQMEGSIQGAVYVDPDLGDAAHRIAAKLIGWPDQRDSDGDGECHRTHFQGGRFDGTDGSNESYKLYDYNDWTLGIVDLCCECIYSTSGYRVYRSNITAAPLPQVLDSAGN